MDRAKSRVLQPPRLHVALLLALLCAWSGCAAVPSAAAPPPPNQWLGTWRGTLLAHIDGQTQAVAPMALQIAATDEAAVVRWCLTYGSGAAADVRDYRLVEVDGRTGQYAIDESGGVVLPARWCGGALVSVFAVAGSTLVVRYVYGGDHLDFELESVAAGAARETGQGIQVWERPAVQRARLWRQR